MKLTKKYYSNADAVIFHGDRLDFLSEIPDKEAQLVVTSPPYNIGKSYEENITIEEYLEKQRKTLIESYRILSDKGSICWQVGNYVNKGEVVPIDMLLYPIFKELEIE